MGGRERPIAVFISRVREERSYIAEESYLLDAILRQQQAYFAVDFEARAVDKNDGSVPSHVPSRLAAISPKRSCSSGEVRHKLLGRSHQPPS